MNRFWTFITDRRVLAFIGMLALAAFLFLGARELQLALGWAAGLFALAMLVWLASWWWRKRRDRRRAKALEEALDQDAEQATLTIRAEDRPQAGALRDRMREAIRTIRTSRLGERTGAAALYELPWYMVIGNPAAGKSTAIIRSGLNFPLAGAKGDGAVVQGLGGTRNCDWFFTSEAILIDTAGRYSVHEEDRAEWLGFLGLLKKHRAKAPINGLLVCASVAELVQGRSEAAIALAKQLRQRVQEITERLEVHAPLYLVFTKADLINGFVEFFEEFDRGERDKVWGATLPYSAESRNDSMPQFDRHFDELHEGLRELALARMSLQRGQALPGGVLSFPLEFAAIKPALSAFVATLFEDNPYQFQPVFRGFYFTSALQEGRADDQAGEQVARRFGLRPAVRPAAAGVPQADQGMFLKGLFQRVVFADRQLVRQYASRSKQRARAVVFAGSLVLLAVVLGGWTWSYVGNRQLAQDVRADLEKAVKLQAERPDLAGRLQAMGVLQQRIEQLRAWRTDRPLGLRLGLYAGDELLVKLQTEYFAGLRQILLVPVAQAIEGYLGEVKATKLQATAEARAATAPSRYAEASPADPEEAYNALKTYLMLAERQRLEAPHLKDQLTRYWRGWLMSQRGSMPVEQLKRQAEDLISFTLQSLAEPSFPVIDNQLALVDDTRAALRTVMRGKPAVERVYAVLRARAATRFPSITVAGIVGEAGKASVAGSQVVGGAYTRRAWQDYLDGAFKDASLGELQSSDWVLGTQVRDDASLSGSPDQIRRALTDLYKADYVREWRQFVQGVAVADFGSFEAAVQQMNRLGDGTESPIYKILAEVHDQTSWDNPAILNQRLSRIGSGIVDWFKRTLLGGAPAGVDVRVDVNAPRAEVPLGPIGREFGGLHRLMVGPEGRPALVQDYLRALAAVRSRFNQIKNQGEPGPAARKLMASTLEGTGSELVDAVKFVDEQMLAGQSEALRSTLRPLLIRPLQQSFAVLVVPAETEINRTWAAQVLEPFRAKLAQRFPFDPASRTEAVPQEIAKVFGPDGAVSKFANDVLGPLVTRRGETLAVRTWLDMGVRLRPEFASGYSQWVAPLEGAAVAGAAGGGGGEATTQFQILPQGAPGLAEYTVDIDGQLLRYRNMAPVWTSFVWPHAGGTPGARITGQTVEGRTVELLNVPGRFGLQRMLETAQRKKRPDGTHDLTWSQGEVSVTLQLRIVSQSGAPPAGGAAPVAGAGGLRGLKLPALIAGGDGAVAPIPAALARPASAAEATR